MKKLYTLIFALMCFACSTTNAQNIPTCNPAFTFQFLTGTTVKFTPAIATDSPFVQHYWRFGDGATSVSNVISPSHTYTPGVYIVTHIILLHNTTGTGYQCIDSLIQTINVVQTTPCTVTASFTQQPSTANSLQINFTNTTAGYTPNDSIRWNFGDGSVSYTNNPSHVFADSGTYHVCLWIKKAQTLSGGTPCSSETCVNVTVAAPCAVQSGYAFTIDPQNPLLLHFTNTTTPLPPPNVNVLTTWYFGDNQTSSAYSADHTFANYGTYYVCLRTQYGTCVSYHCDSVHVPQPTCTLQSNYSFAADNQNPLLIHFTNTTAASSAAQSYSWFFGDGTSATTQNADHAYAQAGVYYACLRVQAGNCVSYHCDSIHVAAAPCTVAAGFTYSADSAATSAPFVYHFVNTTTPVQTNDSIRWSFGDGTISNAWNATHTYSQAGTYNICLRVQTRNSNGSLSDCISEICHSIVVASVCTVQSAYTYHTDSQNYLLIHFTNTTTPTPPAGTSASTTWYFGDGSSASTTNADHSFAAAGTYYVCLRTQYGSCVSYHCDSIHVTAPPCNLTAAFTLYHDSSAGVVPYTYHFTNTSTPVATNDSIRWTFGDGAVSNSYNAVHSYAQAGTYTVCLRVQTRNANGTLSNCISEICHVITISPVCTLHANYSAVADAQNSLLVHFTNTTPASTIAQTYNWYFGDGSSATTLNADHSYAQPGTYYACLRVESGNCVSYHCDSIHVVQSAVACDLLAAFHIIAGSTPTTLSFGFTPNHVYTDVTYTWTFGDGTGTHDVTATHHYATPGYYTVCLTAYRNNSCAATSCMIVQAGGSTVDCSNISLGIVSTVDPVALNQIHFTASSSTAIADQVWTITRIPATATSGTVTLHAMNPVYAFSDTGSYYVCVQATYPNGCVKTFCKTLHVVFPGSTINGCSLQLYPNPATTEINALVNLSASTVITATVYSNMNIQVMQSQQQGSVGLNTVHLNISGLAAGVYIVRVTYGNQVCYATFVKQ